MTRYESHNFRGREHACLDHVRAQVPEHRRHLRIDHLGRQHEDILDTLRVLRGHGGDGRRGEDPRRSARLHVGLDARAAARA